MADAPADLVRMLLADARLPVAGHTQSGGLEPALRLGLRPDQVPGYIEARLATVTRVEAATSVVALHHLQTGQPLTDVETAWAARTPSPAMRRTSHAQGRAFLRLVHRLWPQCRGLTSVLAIPRVSRAVAVAVGADAGGLAPDDVARLVGYDDVQTVAAAALKLLPLDPADVAAWVLQALPAVAALAEDVAQLTAPDRIPATGAPQIEEWAEAHARTTRRLFSA
ncbi:urease accessory UreF family protein [soil metagenome]